MVNTHKINHLQLAGNARFKIQPLFSGHDLEHAICARQQPVDPRGTGRQEFPGAFPRAGLHVGYIHLGERKNEGKLVGWADSCE